MRRTSNRKKNRKKNTKSNKRDYLKGILSVIALIVPLLAYLIFITLIFPVANIVFVSIGIMGAIMISAGVMCLIWLQRGRGVSVAGIGVGVILIGASAFVRHTPIYDKLNEHYVNLYLLIWLAFVISAIWYFLFRGAIPGILRREGASKSAIKKSQKGLRNYWFYDEIHKKYNIGFLFYLNKIFILLFGPFLCLHIILGWHSAFVPAVAIAVCVLCALNVPMWVATQLSARNQNSRNKSSFIAAVSGALFPIFIIVGIITYLAKALA